MKAEPSPSQGAFSSDPIQTQSTRILVVEDNLINQKVIVQQLQSLSYQADIASNGQAALDITAQTYYPIILMDCRLPKVDGFTATRCIRDREQRSNQPKTIIIALTASDDPQSHEEAIQAGMDDFLVKPLRRETLAKTIEHWQGVISQSELSSSSTSEANPNASGSDNTPPSRLFAPELEPYFDLERLNQLADQSWDFAQELLQLYREDTQLQIQQLQQAIEQSDYPQIVHLAHHLKGASANIGAKQIEQIMDQIEVFAQQPLQLRLLQAQLVETFGQMAALLEIRLPN